METTVLQQESCDSIKKTRTDGNVLIRHGTQLSQILLSLKYGLLDVAVCIAATRFSFSDWQFGAILNLLA